VYFWHALSIPRLTIPLFHIFINPLLLLKVNSNPFFTKRSKTTVGKNVFPTAKILLYFLFAYLYVFIQKTLSTYLFHDDQAFHAEKNKDDFDMVLPCNFTSLVLSVICSTILKVEALYFIPITEYTVGAPGNLKK
jgi:hypothetical protein